MKRKTFFCGVFFTILPLFLTNSAALFAQNQTPDNLSGGGKITEQKIDSIVVVATGVTKRTPVAHTSVGKKDLAQAPGTYSIPMILALQPSVVSTSEAGTGFSYTKVSVRGSDDSRVNITLDNIALNDPESQQVFWVNLPALNASLQSIQVQRGIGTSMNGPAAFGGSINMQTITPAAQPYGDAEFALGSFQSYRTILGAGSGRMDNGLSFDMRYSYGSCAGYIRNAKSRQHSLFTTLSYLNGKNSVKLTYIYGDERTGITWEGISLDKYYNDRTYNPSGEYYDEVGNVHYYDKETDDYIQHHLHLTYMREFNKPFVWKTTFAFVKGEGYYQNYKYNKKFSKYGLEPQVIKSVKYDLSDFIIRQSMDNSNYVFNSMLIYNGSKLKGSAGVTYNSYFGDHFGNILWVKHNDNLDLKNHKWYKNDGDKSEISLFARAEYDINTIFTAFADMQYRHIKYQLNGPDSDFKNLDYSNNYNFFNPKIGLNIQASDRNRFYFSVAMGHKEPTRGDLKDPIKGKTTDLIKPEQMIDYEIGYNYISPKFSATANIYFMEYKNQLVASGKLSETGYVIKQNIPDSYRRGIELSLAYQPVKWFRADGNVTFSRNKTKNFTEFIDIFNGDNFEGQREIFHKSTDLTLSPEVISMLMFTVKPFANTELAINGKYIGEQYMDNSSAEISKVPGYFVSALNASHSFNLGRRGSSVYRPRIIVSANLENLFDNRYYSYGWIYKYYYMDGGNSVLAADTGVYTQAPINFMFKVIYQF